MIKNLSEFICHMYYGKLNFVLQLFPKKNLNIFFGKNCKTKFFPKKFFPKKNLNIFFRKKLQDKVQLTIIHVTNKLGQVFNHMEKQPLLLRSNGSTYHNTCDK